MNHDHYADSYIRHILKSVHTIAVLGASPNDGRPSHGVMGFLLGKGYRVFPVNPGHAGKTILGQTVYAHLADVPEPIDMVDVFRRSEALDGVVDEASVGCLRAADVAPGRHHLLRLRDTDQAREPVGRRGGGDGDRVKTRSRTRPRRPPGPRATNQPAPRCRKGQSSARSHPRAGSP